MQTSRAMRSSDAGFRKDASYIIEPIPPPADHPELDLFGIERVRQKNDEEDRVPVAEFPESAFQPDPSEAINVADVPEPLRARMLNEFVYCPRLFYYEQVEGIFVESADTERGSAIHERVDRGKGALPPQARKKRKSEVKGAAVEVSEVSMESVSETEETDLADLKTHRPEASADGGETIHSRSAMLSSERLGVVAKMDLIEVKMAGRSEGDLFGRYEAQSVTPVDYKVGAPRRGSEGNELWDADRMQLGLQILILRDNGYACDEGVIYYRATKQRVRLIMTSEIERWIVGKIEEARALTLSPEIPPPLVNSPKCVRCSLAPVCLPDETRMLGRDSAWESRRGAATEASGSMRQASNEAPRRLIATRDEERALYLNTQGYRVGVKSERLIIKDGESLVDEVRLIDVSHVALFGNVQISTQAVRELCEQEIPVAYFSLGGWFYGLTRGHGLKNVHTRIQQFTAAGNPVRCLEVAQSIVRAKIRNHRTMLMRLHTEAPTPTIVGLKEIAARVSDARGLDELLGMEGAAAALYFQQFAGLIKVGGDEEDDEIPGLESVPEADARRHTAAAKEFTFDFTRRRRRPPTDPVNALLSLSYSLLAKDCTIAAFAVGFDPYVGFYHQPRHGRPALALDLMEEFRPLVAESAVLTAINNRMITPSHFVRAGNAVNLSPIGRKAFFHAYEQRMNSLITHPIFDYKVSYRRVIELQARLLAKWLTGEIPEYVPMTTR